MTRFRSDMARKMTSLLVEIAQRTGHELDQSLVQSRLDEVMLGGNQEKIDEFFDVVLEDLRSVAQGVGNPELVALVTEFEIERERE